MCIQLRPTRESNTNVPSPFRLFWLVFPFLMSERWGIRCCVSSTAAGDGISRKEQLDRAPRTPRTAGGSHVQVLCATLGCAASGRPSSGGAVQQALAIQYHWQDAPRREPGGSHTSLDSMWQRFPCPCHSKRNAVERRIFRLCAGDASARGASF